MPIARFIAGLLLLMGMLLADVGAQAQQSDGFVVACNEPSIDFTKLANDTIAAAHPYQISIIYNDSSRTVAIDRIYHPDGFSYVPLEHSAGMMVIRKCKLHRKYFDTANKLIYDAVWMPGVGRVQCTSFEYNEKGQLVRKQGYAPNDPGFIINYEYDGNGKLRREIQHRASGDTTIEHPIASKALSWNCHENASYMSERLASEESPAPPKYMRSVLWQMYTVE